MGAISVFDMLKIGVGPSSSHTLGPWRASLHFLKELSQKKLLSKIASIKVELFGSLALTGKGHGTDIAIMLGLCGKDPVTIPLEEVKDLPHKIEQSHRIWLNGNLELPFNPKRHLVYFFSKALPFHANGMRFHTYDNRGEPLQSDTYYSIGGGFIIKDGDDSKELESIELAFPIDCGADLQQHCEVQNCSISSLVRKNELAWKDNKEINKDLDEIWETMCTSIYRGCYTDGVLPGGLDVVRRAASIHKKLTDNHQFKSKEDWMNYLKKQNFKFSDIVKWIGCFAMAVNEENAGFGRIVTAPTNGAAGVIPAVLLYYILFENKEASKEDIRNFLLVSGVIGAVFKKGATISAAMGGCQAEIGVSSAMAAAALCERLGGSVGQVLMAAEIAMEHHLGLTCDPVGGLVQVPCIERNSMGAMKAITAAKMAMESDPAKAKVSLDDVIKTMMQTAKDMNNKYKETSQGGLAVNIAISLPEC